MKKLFIAILAAAAAMTMSAQDNPMMRPLPGDPAVKVGKLDNGLTYYIRHNELPVHRAEFYLATNVGAIQETPDQDGLAHFLEHMCFNGTEHFPGKGILNWLQSIGAEFGRNINASTGFEETQYMLNNIPVERETVVDSCLMVLREYAHFVTNATEEIDAERGVIREERRQRRNASWRTFEASLPYYFGDTKYASCTLIGLEESIMGFDPQSLHNFYKTWYHPDMQAVVVVGDVDVDRTEAKIKEIFGIIPAEPNPAQKAEIPFPANKEPVVGVITDPETSAPSIEMIWKSEAAPEFINATIAGELQNYIKRIISMMMDERFNDITAKADAPYISGGFYVSSLIYEAIDAAMGEVTLKEDNLLGGFEAFYTELERMHRFGFQADEFDRAKANIISGLETAAERAATRQNPQLVRPLLSNFFDQTPYLDPKDNLELGKQILSMLTVDVINQVAPQLLTEENLVVIYSGPQKDGIVNPSAEEISGIIAKVKASDIKPLEGEEIASEFLDASKLKGSKVVKTASGPYGSFVWTLKNGVQVYVLPTEYQKDQILLRLYREGGISTVPDAELDSFDDNIWGMFNQNSGVAGFSGTQTSKMLTGKNVSVSPILDNLYNGVQATSTKKDLETAFQLVYLQYAQPRFDEEEYMVGINQLKGILPNVLNTPNFKMQRSFSDLAYNKNPRHKTIDLGTLENASIATVEKNYRRMFADAAGLKLVIVGDVTPEAVKPLVEKYIGSLKKGKKAPAWVDNKDRLATGTVKMVDPTKMETPQSTVVLYYHAPVNYSAANDAALNVLSFIMDMRYVASLREEIGGTYGAHTMGSQQMYPNQQATFMVQFQCKPELCDTLLTVAKRQLAEFCADGPTDEEFQMAVLNLKKNIPENRITNRYWLRQIRNIIEGYGDEDAAYEAAVEALTPEKVRELAALVAAGDNSIEYVMVPSEE
ncbi:MAG: insulinase family protein [Bacteroidales bacterium]|nr:insulinase family protein [Bacteroidales bacterium]